MSMRTMKEGLDKVRRVTLLERCGPLRWFCTTVLRSGSYIARSTYNTIYADILPSKYVQSFCQIGVVHHNGHFVYVIAVHSKSACSPNFEGFPWGMQVNLVYLLRTKLDRNHPVRFAVFSLVLGSTVSMEWSTDCLETAPLVSQISNKLLAGRSCLESIPDIPMYLIWPGGEHKV